VPAKAKPWTTYFENALLLGCFLADFSYFSSISPMIPGGCVLSIMGKKKNKEEEKKPIGAGVLLFKMPPSFAEEKIHLVTCPPDTLELFCWWL
jgi:hypothetical protein